MTIIPIKINQSFVYYPPIPNDFCIIVDTREQTPYKFDDLGINNIRQKLDYGDYSIKGMENIFAVERKNCSDFFGSIGKERKRFKQRIEELSRLDWAGLVIEATEDELLTPQISWSNISPNSVYGSLTSFEVKYGIHVYCGSRENCRQRLINWAIKFYNKIRG